MENIQGAKEVSYFHAPVSSNWTPVFDIWPMGEEQFFLKQNIRTVAGGGERGGGSRGSAHPRGVCNRIKSIILETKRVTNLSHGLS